MPATSEIFHRYLHRIFIETGTHDGAGVRAALAAGYEKVHSIEAARDRYEECARLFENDNRVHLVLGSSDTVLAPLLAVIEEPATIWLDAHEAWGEMLPNTNLYPLCAELTALATAPVRDHTILVDDVRCFAGMGMTVERARDLLLRINPRYVVELIDGNYYKQDVLVATLAPIAEAVKS